MLSDPKIVSCFKSSGAEELLEDSEDMSLNAAEDVWAGNEKMWVRVQNVL